MEDNLVPKPDESKKTHSWFCFKHLTAGQVNTLNVIHLGLGFMLLFMGMSTNASASDHSDFQPSILLRTTLSSY